MSSKPKTEIEYFILRADDTLALAEAVMTYSKTGWMPLGGVAVAVDNQRVGHPDVRFYQSIMRRPE